MLFRSGEQKPLFEIEVEEEVVVPPVIETPIAPIEQEKPVEIVEHKITEPVKKAEEIKSINDKFSSQAEKQTLADKLGQQPIQDLTKSIGLNQKFLFMNDLFEAENQKYKEAIEIINNFSDFTSANAYINENLVSQLNWDLESVSAQKFIEIVKRRFL